jgi:hypothetical protein
MFPITFRPQELCKPLLVVSDFFMVIRRRIMNKVTSHETFLAWVQGLNPNIREDAWTVASRTPERVFAGGNCLKSTCNCQILQLK